MYPICVNSIDCNFQEKETNCLTREIQLQERKNTALETTVRHMESDIKKKQMELECKNIFLIFFVTLFDFYYI